MKNEDLDNLDNLPANTTEHDAEAIFNAMLDSVEVEGAKKRRFSLFMTLENPSDRIKLVGPVEVRSDQIYECAVVALAMKEVQDKIERACGEPWFKKHGGGKSVFAELISSQKLELLGE